MVEDGYAGVPIEDLQYWTSHHQVPVHAPDGNLIYVDEGISELLVTLWSLGYTTAYSCSGGTENISRSLENKKAEGYIYFETEDMARNFVTTASKKLPARRNSYYLETAGGLQGKVIRFQAKMIPLFLETFKADNSKLASEALPQKA